MGYNAEAAQQLEAAREQEKAAVRAAKERVEQLAGALGGLDFSYRCGPAAAQLLAQEAACTAPPWPTTSTRTHASYHTW
jgi:hypothetical protein